MFGKLGRLDAGQLKFLKRRHEAKMTQLKASADAPAPKAAKEDFDDVSVKSDEKKKAAVKEYHYGADHSEDSDAYESRENKRFFKLSKRKRQAWVKKLWRRAYAKALSASKIIDQFLAIHTKMQFFGRQLLNVDKRSLAQAIHTKEVDTTWLIMPTTLGKQLWDIGIILILFYTATYAPYRTAFGADADSAGIIRYFDYLVDGMFILDIFVTFLTPYERFDGALVYSHKRIARNYIFGAFVVDVVASFPTEIIEYMVQADAGERDNGQAQKLLRLARLQRLYRLLRILRVVKLIKITKYNSLFGNFIERLKIKPGQSRVIVMFCSGFLGTHLMACFWFLCAKMNDFGADTWVVNVEILDESTVMKYSRSMYWAFQTLTTVGYGDFGAYNGWEIFLTLWWMFLGVSFYTVVVGSLTSMVTASDAEEEDLQLKIKALDIFAADTQLDPRLHTAVKTFLQNNFGEITSKVEIDGMIDELPPTLKEEVFYHQYGQLMQKFYFFQN